MRQKDDVSKILVYRIGQLGDTIVSIPAMQFFREQFPHAQFTLMSDAIVGAKHVLAGDVFENTPLFERFMSYPKAKNGRIDIRAKLALLMLALKLYFKHFDAVVYLAPSMRTEKQVRRDRRYFSFIGAKKLWGFQRASRVLAPQQHEADWLLAQFQNDGFAVPRNADEKMDLMISEQENSFAKTWLQNRLGERNGSLVVGFGPGTKMPAKRWRIDNFWAVGHSLIKKYNIQPIVFGDASDRKAGDALVASWKRGCNAAGELSVRQSAALLQQCDLFIGNDTGTMHLAAAANTPCVAIFSARDERGKWAPLGDKHIVLRKDVKCQRCMATACDDRICLMLIRPEEATAAAENIIQEIMRSNHAQAD